MGISAPVVVKSRKLMESHDDAEPENVQISINSINVCKYKRRMLLKQGMQV